MRDVAGRPAPELQAAALRYAAGDLSPGEAADFESLLADDQSAREAVAEAVRLSAAALGQDSPSPDRSFRGAIRERVSHAFRWTLLRRRAYRGSPLFWTGVGLTAAVGLVVLAIQVDPGMPPSGSIPSEPVVERRLEPDLTPAPPRPSQAKKANPGRVPTRKMGPEAAEIWAELSTPGHVERTHDEELRRRQRQREWDRRVPSPMLIVPSSGPSLTPEN